MSAARAVLVVDDSAAIRQLILATLADSGLDLLEAPDGYQALALAAEHRPVLVLMDVDMPGLDGIETCRRLRGLPESRGTRVVMLTGSAPESEQAARAAGADLFLTKPFSPLDLLQMVEQLSRETVS